MKALIYFQPGNKYDNYEGARMRKTIKGALEVVDMQYTSNIYDEYDSLMLNELISQYENNFMTSSIKKHTSN